MASLDALGLKVLLAKNVRPDGTLDLEGAKKILKENYRKVAFAYHPDRNPGDASAEEIFKQAGNQYDLVQESDESKASRYILDYINSADGDSELLARAVDCIKELKAEKHELETLLADAQANILHVANGRRRQAPEMIVVYQNPAQRIRITLANAATEIPRLISGRPDPALEQRLQQAERDLNQTREELNRTKAYSRDQNNLAQEWQRRAKDAERTASFNKAEAHQYETQLAAEKGEKAFLDGKYQTALKTFQQEKEAREVQQKRAEDLESTLKAATELLARKLSEHQAELERIRITSHKQLEDIRKNPTSSKILEKIKKARDTKQYDKALELCELILDAEPGNTHALYFQGTNFEALGRWEDAGRSYHQLTILAPGHTSGKAAYTRIEQQLLTETRKTRGEKQYEASLQAAQSLLRINPTHQDALYFAGANAAQLGQKAEAIAYLEQLPKHSSAQALLASLK